MKGKAMKTILVPCKICIFMLVIFLTTNTAISQVLQNKTIDRPHEAYFNNSRDVAEFQGVAIGELHLYAFRDSKWMPIPFQIDERDDINGGPLDYFATHNGLLDPDDEIVHMVRDLGDRVTLGNWIDNDESKQYVRYE